MASNSTTIKQFANDPETTGELWAEISIPLTIFTCIIIGIRMWWRFSQTGRLGRADISICSALAMVIIQLGLGAAGILQWGFGHHLQYLLAHGGLILVQKSLMYFYLYQIAYKITVSLTKMSFLFLYLDIFTGHPRFRIICHITNASVAAAMIAFTLATTFQCTPIALNWDKTIKDGECFNAPAFWYAHAAWNTLFDLFILALPIPVIRSLQMGRNQKAALIGVFALGAFVCVTSIMRMISLDIAAKSVQTDITHSTGRAFIWTQVESCVSIICACLPTLKAPISRLLPRLFSSNFSSNKYNLEETPKVENSRGGHGNWKDTSGASGAYAVKGGNDSDEEAGTSQEYIMGIKKTVDVEISTKDLDTAQGERERQREQQQFGDRFGH